MKSGRKINSVYFHSGNCVSFVKAPQSCEVSLLQAWRCEIWLNSTQTRLVRCQPANPHLFTNHSLRPTAHLPLSSAIIRQRLWITHKELFIDQNSQGSSLPHGDICALRQSPPCVGRTECIHNCNAFHSKMVRHKKKEQHKITCTYQQHGAWRMTSKHWHRSNKPNTNTHSWSREANVMVTEWDYDPWLVGH